MNTKKKKTKGKKHKPLNSELVIEIKIFDNDTKVWDDRDPLGVGLAKFNKFCKEKGL